MKYTRDQILRAEFSSLCSYQQPTDCLGRQRPFPTPINHSVASFRYLVEYGTALGRPIMKRPAARGVGRLSLSSVPVQAAPAETDRNQARPFDLPTGL
jgi:hypothetical protein